MFGARRHWSVLHGHHCLGRFHHFDLSCRSNCRASRTPLQNLGVDCCVYRAAGATAGVLVPELASQERRACLRALKAKKRPADVVSAAVMVGRTAIGGTPDASRALLNRCYWPEASFSLGAGRCESLPKGVHVLMITDVHRFHERASVQDRIHHAGKTWRVGVMKVGYKHSSLSVGHHDLM